MLIPASRNRLSRGIRCCDCVSTLGKRVEMALASSSVKRKVSGCSITVTATVGTAIAGVAVDEDSEVGRMPPHACAKIASEVTRTVVVAVVMVRMNVASFKGLPEPLAVSYLGEQVAPLLAFAVGLRRIAEGENSQHV